MKFGTLIFSFCIVIGCCVEALDPDQLRILYNKLGGPTWSNQQGWSDPTNRNPKTWYGVGDDLNLKDNNLVGELPNEFFGVVSEFYAVRMSENPGITGALPGYTDSGVNNNLNAFECDNCRLTRLPTTFPPSLNYLSLSSNTLEPFSLLQFLNNAPNVVGFDFTDTPLGLDISSSDMLQALADRQKSIQQIYLRNCSLIGSLEQWPELLNLAYLDLANNELKGSIPDWLWISQMIETLHLYNNKLSGNSPQELATPKLASLLLSGNEFKGELPSLKEISQSIIYFSMSGCGLTGEIPLKDFVFPKLLQIDISGNYFSGAFPDITAPSLEAFYASYNQFEGGLPSLNYVNLTYFSVQGNSMKGTLPPSLFSLQKLEQFNVSVNHFSGSLPQTWSNPNLKGFSLFGNGLSGPFPSPANCTNIVYFEISDNHFSGKFPDFPHCSELFEFAADNNLFTSMPPSLNCPKLAYFDMTNNLLTGTFSTGFDAMPSLVNVGASNNNLTGSIPRFNSQSLSALILSNNSFTGTLPSTLSSLSSLTFFGVENNSLSGDIPDFTASTNLEGFSVSNNLFTSLPSFINNRNIKYFAADNNRLRGGIPSSVSNMNQLINFVVNNNSLSGELPGFNSNFLDFMDISNNLLNGSVPDFNTPSLQYLNMYSNNFSGDLNFDWFVNKGALMELLIYDNKLTGFLNDINNVEVETYLPASLDLHNNRINGTLNFNPLHRLSQKVVQLDLSNNLLSGNLNFQIVRSKRGNPTGDVIFTNTDLRSNSPLIVFKVSHNQLIGSVAMSNSLFPSLWNLFLNDNQFNGTLTGDLSGLVDVSNNQFKGQLNNGKGRVASLKAANNQFTSLFDVSTTNLDILTFLDVANNSIQLVGKGITLATNLRVMNLSGNPLKSFEHSYYSSLLQLTDLNLSKTTLSSNIPDEIGALRSLTNFDISYSHFYGRIPDSLGKLAYLTYFNASRNSIEGNIPSSFKYSRYLEVLDLSYNNLVGGIEESVGYLVSLTYLDLSNNFLNGTISNNVASLLDMKVLKASNNLLSGNLPGNFPHNINQLDLSNNTITGSIPDNFGELNLLVSLDLSSNLLKGNLPKSLEKLNHLENLYLESNEFNLPNALKPTWGEAINCDARENQWECPLPGWMLRHCKTSECKVSSNSSADLELRIVKKEQEQGQDEIKREIGNALNVSLDRITVNYVRDGGLFTPPTKRQNSSPSTLVGLTFSPPSQGKESEGSAQRNRDILLSLISDSQDIGTLSVLQYSETLSTSSGTTNAVINNGQKEAGDKLSTYAIIGIAVGGGVLLIIVIVVVIVAIVFAKRRKGNQDVGLEMILKSDVMLTDVTIGKCIGEGHFGAVYVGSWNNTPVALKSLKGEADVMNKWAEEVSLLSKLNHPNVVRLLGIYNANEIFYMVLEFYERGSLDNFLRNTEYSSKLNVSDLIFMAIEVSKGMIYLESKGIIHRDLGARNLLVTESDGKFCIKISDFGMSRETNFYETKDKKIPFRWAAPEVIQFSQSSFKADVWSYAVCLWEIFSKGEIPFRSYTNKQVVEIVVDQKKHLEKPAMCPDDVFALMEQCWSYEAKNRPTFLEIYNRVLKIHGALPTSTASPNIVSAEGFYHDEAPGKEELSVGVYQFG
eukprot:TRINITY_DN4014_c1_g1_i1.p1 TRINITY_DN4014_c1_g1~~TRINITY_DN4014_c1_g1_i1.p1  ORF type:complete len:1625 (-),score=589.56 TRINITY_DN4014_c1_g1_i1:7-4881(-)